MAERNHQDTRRYRRLTLRVLVDYLADAGICCDYATTLGAGGMFLETDEPLKVGMMVKTRFRLPQGEELHELEGKVVWRREASGPGQPIGAGGAGIKFTNQKAMAKLARELEDYEL